MIEVEEAYIHCSKHIPLLVRQDRRERVAEGRRPAGDDYFGVGRMRGVGLSRHEAGKPVG